VIPLPKREPSFCFCTKAKNPYKRKGRKRSVVKFREEVEEKMFIIPERKRRFGRKKGSLSEKKKDTLGGHSRKGKKGRKRMALLSLKSLPPRGKSDGPRQGKGRGACVYGKPFLTTTGLTILMICLRTKKRGKGPPIQKTLPTQPPYGALEVRLRPRQEQDEKKRGGGGKPGGSRRAKPRDPALPQGLRKLGEMHRRKGAHQ